MDQVLATLLILLVLEILTIPSDRFAFGDGDEVEAIFEDEEDSPIARLL